MSQDDCQESQDSTMTVMQEDRHEVLYFAYGSNLSTEQMRQRCPFSTPVGLAYLEGWKWFINGRGYANVAQLDGDAEEREEDGVRYAESKGKGKGRAVQEEKGVYGLLYLLPPQDEERLDGYEGVPYSYQKFQVEVKWARKPSDSDSFEVDDDEEVLRALIYVDTERMEDGPPREEYIGRMERGIEDAVENWGMDEDYADRVMRRLATPTSSGTSHLPPRLTKNQIFPSRGFRYMHSSKRSFPAIFARGGTSNGLVIDRRNLPPEDQWHTVLPSAMGSPDPYGRQLDGMGSGISSTSKIVILGPATRPDVDVDFTFVQVGIRDGALDKAGNCGNMSSLVGPVAFDSGIVKDVPVELDQNGDKWATVRFLNTNTNKVMTSRFKVAGEPLRYSHEGDYVMDGVPGTGSEIVMSFMDPAGAKTGKALPTGNPVDELELPDGTTVKASLVDVGNPGVFVRTDSLGLANHMDLTPPIVEANAALKDRLADIRRAGASRMGLDPNIESVPKIVLLFPSSGSPDIDIRCLALSMGQAHKAAPLTLALCLGAASQLPGTIASDLIAGKSKKTVTIGHPSGMVDIGTVIVDGKIESAQLLRTAKILMEGQCLTPLTTEYSDMASEPVLAHPYYPLNVHIPGYVPNETPVIQLLPVFGIMIGSVIGLALRQTSRARVSLRPIDRFAAAWFAMCNVETITAFAWGPLSLLTLRGILSNSRSRHVMQIIVCVAHLYGVIMYYLTNWMEGQMYGVVYSRPEVLYYWIYYIGFNAPWVIVPVVLLWDSWQQIGKAFAALEVIENPENKKKK
ncbi:PrpF protein-domain-containing protein [Mariannaea sp. PMI_226]|nr:PrpF protein-domain-containing protein [Mariannaea sp. PMI_226]